MKNLIIFFAFITIAIYANSQNVIRGEYFIDADPGFGSGTTFVISLPDSDITQAINIPYSAFPGTGYHYVYMRTLDVNGSWNLTAKRIVEVDDTPYLLNAIQVEYFFDSDAGFGNNSSAVLTPSTDSTWTFDIPYNQLPFVANDTLFVRVLDNPKVAWSITTTIDSLNIGTLGLAEINASVFTISPNPSYGKIKIEFTKVLTEPLNFTLTNLLGEKVQEQIITERVTEINLKQSEGIYFITLNNSKERTTKKIVLKVR